MAWGMAIVRRGLKVKVRGQWKMSVLHEYQLRRVRVTAVVVGFHYDVISRHMCGVMRPRQRHISAHVGVVTQSG